MDHRAQVGIECPRCHNQQFMELQLEIPEQLWPVAREVRQHLEEWIASRCPNHLAPILKAAKN